MTGFRSRQLARIRARKAGTVTPFMGLKYPAPSNTTAGFASGAYDGLAQPVAETADGVPVMGYGKSGATQTRNRRIAIAEKVVTWAVVGALVIGGLIVVNKFVLKR